MRSVLLRLGGIKVHQLQVAAQKDLWKDINTSLDIIEKYRFLWKIGDRRTLTSLLIFTPKFGEDEPILSKIFQMGWFNHQLDI